MEMHLKFNSLNKTSNNLNNLLKIFLINRIMVLFKWRMHSMINRKRIKVNFSFKNAIFIFLLFFLMIGTVSAANDSNGTDELNLDKTVELPISS